MTSAVAATCGSVAPRSLATADASGPGRMVLDELGAPVISPAGTLRPDGNLHGPNEHGAVEDYLDHAFSARLLEHPAAEGGPAA